MTDIFIYKKKISYLKLLKTWGDSAEGPCIDRVTCSLIPCSKPITGKRKLLKQLASYHLFLSRNFTKLSFKFVENCDGELKVSYFYLRKGPSHKNNPTKRKKTTSTATSKIHSKNQHWVSIYKWFTLCNNFYHLNITPNVLDHP